MLSTFSHLFYQNTQRPWKLLGEKYYSLTKWNLRLSHTLNMMYVLFTRWKGENVIFCSVTPLQKNNQTSTLDFFKFWIWNWKYQISWNIQIKCCQFTYMYTSLSCCNSTYGIGNCSTFKGYSFPERKAVGEALQKPMFCFAEAVGTDGLIKNVSFKHFWWCVAYTHVAHQHRYKEQCSWWGTA